MCPQMAESQNLIAIGGKREILEMEKSRGMGVNGEFETSIRGQ